MRCILLNPGPVSLSESVRKAAVSFDLSHREPEFFALQDRLCQGLLDVYGCNSETWAAILLGGSGTTAVEAMVSSLLPRDARVLVVENGDYGERIAQIAHVHGISCGVINHDSLEEIDYQRVDDMLGGGLYTHLAAVLHETSTGRVNDIRRLARICEQHGVSLLLDAVSGFGGEDLPLDSPALAACAGTANQCLHGIPGLSFVLARRSALGHCVDPPRSLSLHLPLWHKSQENRSTPFTPPVNAMLALEKALENLQKQGGWPKRKAHYEKLSGQVRRCLLDFGVEPLLAESGTSSALHAYRVPKAFSFKQIHDGLKRWGFVISSGPGDQADPVFRISTMGDITHYDVERLLAAIETVFKKQ